MKGCRPLTDHEISTVLNAFEGAFARRDRLLFVFGIHTGLRVSELLSIDVCDVWAGHQVRDRVHIQKRNTKGKRAGTSMPLNAALRAELKVWFELPANHSLSLATPLFVSRKGKARLTRKAAWQALMRAFERASIRDQLGTHTMRKTFAKRIYHALNNDLVKTQLALRHSNISTTIHYLGADQGDIDDAILGLST